MLAKKAYDCLCDNVQSALDVRGGDFGAFFANKKLGSRYRESDQMRHASVTWNLMIGKNLLWLTQNHGHSAAVMLKAHAKWLKGSAEKDVAKISGAMGFATSHRKRQRPRSEGVLRFWRRERDSNPRYRFKPV